MLYFLYLSLFFLFQANYGLRDEELRIQKLLDYGSPDDKSHDEKSTSASCVTSSKVEDIRDNNCPKYTKPSWTDTLMKVDWNKTCRDRYKQLECVHRKLKEVCEDLEVTEFLKEHYKDQTVYACYYCKDYVDYLQENFNVTVQQVDLGDHELETLNCRVNETAGEECVTKLAAPLISKCNSDLNVIINSDKAKCDALQCIHNNIEAVCGINKAMEYWQEHHIKEAIFETVRKQANECIIDKELKWTHPPAQSEWQTQLQADWEVKCRHMYNEVYCFFSSLQNYCPDFTNGSSHVLEDIIKDYEMPKVYACHLCKDLVDYVYENLSLTLQQVDDDNNTLDVTCPVNETADCATINAGPLIAKYNSTVNQTFDSDQERWRTNCANLQHIGEHIEAICGKNVTKQYWEDEPPKVYACYYCKNFVDYIRGHFDGLVVQQIDDNGTTVDGLTCPAVPGDPQCLNNLVTLHFIAECEGTFKLANTYRINSKEDCEIMNKLVPCSGKHIEAICGPELELQYWNFYFRRQVSPIKVSACWYCNDMVEYLGNIPVRVQQSDADDKIQTNDSFVCPRPEEKESCTTRNAKPFADQCFNQFNDVERDNNKKIGDAVIYCRRIYILVKCIYKKVEPICGNESALKYIGDTTDAIDVKYCPYCNEAIDYMENLGAHLARKDGKGYCRKADCDNSTLKAVIDKECPFKNVTSPEQCSVTYNAVQCANVKVVEQCGDLFGDDYMSKNYTPPNVYPCWHCKQMITYLSKFNRTVQQIDRNETLLGTTCPLLFTGDCPEKNAQPMIEECKNLQIETNITLAADREVSQNVCSSIYESVKCIHERVGEVCGEAPANETIKTMEFKTHANCDFCTDAINFTERYGGHLDKEYNTSQREHCIRPDCNTSRLNIAIGEHPTLQTYPNHEDFCREVRKFAEEAYKYVNNACYGNRAADYMRAEIEIKVYPCAYCTEVMEYMRIHEGTVYQADKNGNPLVMRSAKLTCPVGINELFECPKINARIFVDRCKETFYEATSWGRPNEKVGKEYCSAQYVMLNCIFNEVEAVCGKKEAKRHMKTEEYPDVRGDMCEDCNASVTFMNQYGGHVYIRDQPGAAVCKPNKIEEKKKPVSSANSYYASGYYIHFLSLLYFIM